jgi:gas vesicle protein
MNKAVRLLTTIGACMAVGAALGLLFAPDEGVETRKKLMKRGRKLAGTVNDSIDEGKESLEEIKEVLSKQLTKVNRKLEEIKF